MIRIISLLIISCLICNGYRAQQSSKEKFRVDTLLIKEEVSYISEGLTGKWNDSILNCKFIPIRMQMCTDSFVTFETGNIISIDKLVSIFITRFDKTKHKLTTQNEKLLLIDGKRYWGADSVIPKIGIKRVGVLYGSHHIIAIPDTAFSDLYEPRLCTLADKKTKRKKGSGDNSVYQSKDKKRVYICMKNGESGSLYSVIWIISNARYYGRVVKSIES